MHPPDGSNTQRALSIDIIRGFALICMVVIHFMVYFGNAEAMNTWLYFSLNHILGDWGASGFLMIMGISQALSGRKHTDLSNRVLFKRALIRGVFIFTIGLTMLALACRAARSRAEDMGKTRRQIQTRVVPCCAHPPACFC
jgi:uncharacterized membrane protein